MPPGLVYDKKKPIQRKGIEPTQVKSIKLLTELDGGAANDNLGTIKPKSGIVFGKTYKFKVDAYTNGVPIDKKTIKWKYRYHSLSQNKWIEHTSKVTGEEYNLHMNNKDICGRTLHLIAYINDEDSEGYLKIWHHNRFRWFDRKVVYKQIEDRVKDFWRIKQGSSSLCGMAALYYAMLKRDPKEYKKLAQNLFRTGEHSIGKYTIKPHEKALGMYDVKTTDSNYIAMGMFEIDWIVLATTRSKESLDSKFVYKGFEDGRIDMLKAVNWPDMLTRICKEVAGFSNAISHNLGFNAINNKKRLVSARIHDYFSNSDLEELQNIDKAYKLGHTILMMIDADMIDNKSSYNSVVDIGNDSHWVVYEGGLQFFDKNSKVTSVLDDVESLTFRIFTWGYNPVDYKNEKGKPMWDKDSVFLLGNNTISVKSFKSNYYGYIEVY
ncbi:hypothetical protein OF897_06990 [Chryseobacterium formosus]|uniref:Uncharacterized protein n=1 Tax=Chryseobacterium formosus TaxID=1537363 RepID=A0ABT3XPV0_9FLAO|nr:hypothetical protein [Chryseobacterium formosus]MCX8523666.1 hypothetical protein [Chryseobacterium formosus]